jgi:cytochrome c553
MKRVLLASLAALVPVIATAADSPPDWAFPTAGNPPPLDDGQVRHVPGSTKAYTYKQVNDASAVPDWFPDEHPPMPDIVAHGKAPTVSGCALCHLANGLGHPESANLAGLPAAYIEEQIAAYKNGERQSSTPGRSAGMVRFSKAITDDEAKQGAAYFASLKQVPWTQVIEADMAPKTFIGQFSMRFKSPGNDTEPIGHRMIEFPVDQERAELRDPHASFVAYVPTGSIVAGEKLVTMGGGKTTRCTGCHGVDLKGKGDVPGIAGRSPIYLFRQLYDIQHGTWKGTAVVPMLAVVKNLNEDDMIAVSAYVASRLP